jgi:hypothetical protein
MSTPNQPTSRKTIRERRQEQKREERKTKAVSFSDFLIDWKRNPMIAIGLGGSGFLTALMGLFIGLNPRLNEAGVLELFGGQNTTSAAAIGIFFGIVYMAAFPILGEYGTYYWHRKLALREDGNWWQFGISLITLLLAAAFTITTAVSASFVLATLLHTFEVFNAIPEWVQYWTILIIPIALALHAGTNMAYDHVSEYAADRRAMQRELDEAENEAENQIRQARVNARKRAALTAANEYERMANTGAVEAGMALAKKTWEIDSKKMGTDSDGDGIPDYLDEEPYQAEPSNRDNHRERAKVYPSDEPDFPKPRQ